MAEKEIRDMTEEEAKTKVCCGPEGCGYYNDNPRPARWCEASACMAWRWWQADPHMTTADGFGKLTFYDKDGNQMPDSPLLIHGFCGLAGRP